jgi:hypothetical protein
MFEALRNLMAIIFTLGKMKMEFFLHVKDLWEITLGELLPPRIKFGEIVPKGGIHDHQMCMKKDKLACGTIFLNVVDSMLDHVACVKSAKKT